MSLSIRFLPAARAEYDAAVDWYERQRPGLGADFISRVGDALRRISVNPKLHAVVYQDVRKAVVRQFPYIILYQEEPNEVLVISVFHTARDPSAWQSRV